MEMENENQTKKLIFQTALRLFREKSFQEVTVNEICKQSGITKHTFYYHFPSKDALLKRFYVIPSEITPADLSTILNAESYVEQLWLLSKSMVDFLVETDLDIIRQIFIKNITSDVGTFNVSEKHKQMLELQIGIIKKGQQSGQFLNTSDAQTLASVYRHSIVSNTIMRLMNKTCNHPTEAIRFLFEAIFNVAPEFRKLSDSHFEDFFPHKEQ